MLVLLLLMMMIIMIMITMMMNDATNNKHILTVKLYRHSGHHIVFCQEDMHFHSDMHYTVIKHN